MRKSFTYDVFLSYSTKDKIAVRELAQKLRADGINVWLDEWEIKPGDIIGIKVEEGLAKSRVLILIMSANAFASDWVKLERHTILFRDPTNALRRFIPLRIDNSEPTDVLKQFSYIDWRNKSEDEYSKLLDACRQTVTSTLVNDKSGISRFSKILKGHLKQLIDVAITPDGSWIVSASEDKSLKIWDCETGICLATFHENNLNVNGVAISTDGNTVLSSSYESVKVWDRIEGKSIKNFKLKDNHRYSGALVFVDEENSYICGTYGKSIQFSSLQTGATQKTFRSTSSIRIFGTSINAKWLAFTNEQHQMQVWDVESQKCLNTLTGHVSDINSLSISADGEVVVTASRDYNIKVWNTNEGRCVNTLEGHTGNINNVTITADKSRIFSSSEDGTVRIWDVLTGKCIKIFEFEEGVRNMVVTPNGNRAVITGNRFDFNIYLLDLSQEDLQTTPQSDANRYTNAKVLLVGDSGVGKSGLAIRLTEDRFQPTISTDAAWATHLKLPKENNDGDIEREIWLWDFAGQADYRLIHQLFMDETSLAVLVFNPQHENPFEGLSQWTQDLKRAARRPFVKLLVAGRCDRGGLMVAIESIQKFCGENNFNVYLETSANTGKGCVELREAIIQNIEWGEVPWTSSPHIFQLLKKEIVRLKDEKKVLLRFSELKQQLEMKLHKESFTAQELRAVVGLLAGPGVVWKLEFGDFVLLQPEVINSYAAAVVRKVRGHIEEIGLISEEDVLLGNLDFQDMNRLPIEEEQIILRAMHQTFVDHGLCLREQTDSGTLLVFPSYFKRERPVLDSHPSIFVTYQFSGQLDDIYSTLIVKLHHTPSFQKDQLWRFAADFKTPSGRKIGLKMTKLNEGVAEIAIYFEQKISNDVKVTFIKYVHDHLNKKALNITRLRYYSCSYCGTPVENRKTAKERLENGKKDIVCVSCEKRIKLWDIIEEKFASEQIEIQVQELEEKAQLSIDNQSKELILLSHAFAISGEAGQIFRPTSMADWGIDGEIEFKNDSGQASGERLYLQLKSGDSYLYKRKSDGKQIFKISKTRLSEYWTSQRYPVMLVIRTSDNGTQWMNVSSYLKKQKKGVRQIVFEGEPFNVLNVLKLRDRILKARID